MWYGILFFLLFVLGFLVGMKVTVNSLVAADKKERNKYADFLDKLILRPRKDKDG